jgi:two-component system sensor histidine kinase KdpD
MDEEGFKNPDELLDVIQREEEQKNKGRLKIFFGMCAGVGKTYAMLKEAQELRREGINVVVGTVETHGRADTALLLLGLDTIPEKSVTYRDRTFKELDIEVILAQRPSVVLIDELAHSNIPGSKHAKRWQDVIEILDNGIDVYTTLNVQHIESLNDKIRGISQVTVQETVPDLIIEKASSIQLVDLTPEELLQRLKYGKVYLGDQSQLAAQHFFQKDRLIALREIALRYAAEKVDYDLRYSIPSTEQTIQWKPREKFLVAVSHSPNSQKLVRTTRRLAANMDAPWTAIHVHNGKKLNEKDTNQLAKNLQLARDLGAEVITINDPNIAEGLQRIARQKGITQIILGKTSKSIFFDFLLVPTLLDKLSTGCSDIDIHVIRQESLLKGRWKNGLGFSFKGNFLSYSLAFLYVCFFTAFSTFLLPIIGYKIVGIVFLIAILVLSLMVKKGPVFFASFLFGLSWNFFFIPQIGQFVIHASEDVALLAIFMLTAVATVVLADRAKEHKDMLVENEASARTLYDLGQQIISAQSTEEVFNSVKDHLEKKFDGKFDLSIKDIDGGLIIKNSLLIEDKTEENVANWAFQKGQEAGWSTDTLPSSKNLYIPLKVFHDTVGVLIFRPNTQKLLLFKEKSFLYAVCRQLAIYIERLFSEEKARQHLQSKQMENIQRTILEHISNELEPPLNNVEEAIESLKNKITSIKEVEHFSKEVYQLERSFNVFHRIVSNITAMARLSEGIVNLNKHPQDIEIVIEKCCEQIKKIRNGHEIKTHIQKGLPSISVDLYLIHMLLYNLIINALENSPPLSTIEIDAKIKDKVFVLSVSDEGAGIPEDQLEKIFEKFYRLSESSSPGMGLGLAIAKTVAKVHNGYLKAENLSPKGSKFSLFLPM